MAQAHQTARLPAAPADQLGEGNRLLIGDCVALMRALPAGSLGAALFLHPPSIEAAKMAPDSSTSELARY